MPVSQVGGPRKRNPDHLKHPDHPKHRSSTFGFRTDQRLPPAVQRAVGELFARRCLVVQLVRYTGMWALLVASHSSTGTASRVNPEGKA